MSGRIRSIKPEILEDEKVAGLSHLEFRLFVGSWLLADDYGNLRADPNYIRGQIVWGSDESRENVAKAIEGLARVSLLIPYVVRGQSYLHISGWEKHQRVDKPGKPRMPLHTDPEAQRIERVAGISRESRESLANIPGSLAPDLRPPTSDLDPEREQEGERGNQSDAAPAGAFFSFDDSKKRVEPPKPPRGRRKRKLSDPTPAELESVRVILEKLSEQSDVNYTGNRTHTALIVGRLREGITEADMRCVVAYCAIKKGWKGDDKWGQYLRPETLFGPEKIHTYLEPARSWFNKLPPDEPEPPRSTHTDAEIEPAWMGAHQ